MIRFKNIEALWAYAKEKMPNGCVVSKLSNNQSEKYFSIEVPKALVNDSKLVNRSKVTVVFTAIKGDDLIDAFIQETNTEFTILNDKDFSEALWFVRLNESVQRKTYTLFEAVQTIMAPVKVGDSIKIVDIDGDTETSIATGIADEILSVPKAIDKIKKDNTELYDIIMTNGYKNTDKAYKINGSWFVDDNEHNIYALLNESAEQSPSIKAVNLIQQIETAPKNIPSDKIRDGINMLSDYLDSLMHDPMANVKAITRADNALDKLKNLKPSK